MNRWAFMGIGAGLLSITLLIDVGHVIRCGNGLTPWVIGDPFAEANSLRAAERFVREGFSVNWWLADTS
jgi:hypothetical protein